MTLRLWTTSLQLSLIGRYFRRHEVEVKLSLWLLSVVWRCVYGRRNKSFHLHITVIWILGSCFRGFIRTERPSDAHWAEGLMETVAGIYAESAMNNLRSCRKSNPGLHFTELLPPGDYLNKSLEIRRYISGIVWRWIGGMFFTRVTVLGPVKLRGFNWTAGERRIIISLFLQDSAENIG